jgi:hypothetical protein
MCVCFPLFAAKPTLSDTTSELAANRAEYTRSARDAGRDGRDPLPRESARSTALLSVAQTEAAEAKARVGLLEAEATRLAGEVKELQMANRELKRAARDQQVRFPSTTRALCVCACLCVCVCVCV